jgi:uncharacterized protein
MNELTTTQMLFAALGGLLIGFNKAGIKGIGIIIVTMMAIVFGARASTGIILPLLMVGDILAVIYYKKHAQWHLLLKLLPWMIAGVLIGVLIGKDLPEDLFKNGMAIIIMISAIMMYFWERRKSTYIPNQWWVAGIMGVLAGITTMIGNLAGAFANIFFLAMRIPKNEFIGTAAWLFFIINIFKLPFHIFVWHTIDYSSLQRDFYLFPMVIIGFTIGVKLIQYIKEEYYRKFILFMTALGALIILLK